MLEGYVGRAASNWQHQLAEIKSKPAYKPGRQARSIGLSMSKKKVLIVEDDQSLAEIVGYNIGQAGFEVVTARDGKDGLHKAQINNPDIIVLDLMLPGIDGLEVCRRLRAEPSTRDILVLMLTAKSEETDEVVGFSVGADDYVTKPFSVKVLVERMKALLRRREANSVERDVISSQNITVDSRRHKVIVDDVPLELTPSEFRLLNTMIRQPGRAFSRDELIDSALGEHTIVLERTIDVHIRALRKKMGAYADVIETVRGIGYRFRDTSGKIAATLQE